MVSVLVQVICTVAVCVLDAGSVQIPLKVHKLFDAGLNLTKAKLLSLAFKWFRK